MDHPSMRCSPARRRAHPVLRWTTALALAMWLPGSAAAAPPERSTVYVANSGSESVSAIDVATGSVRATIALGEQVGGTAMAVAADGQRAFIADAARDRVRLWDLRRRAVAASIPVQAPRTIVLPPDGQAVFVLSDTDAGAELLILDPADLAVRHRVALGGNAELRLDTKGAILLADVVHRDQSAAVFRIDPASGTVLGFTAVDAPVQRGFFHPPTG